MICPGDIVEYHGVASALAKVYEPDDDVVADGNVAGWVTRWDRVLVLACLDDEMLVLKGERFGWVRYVNFEQVPT